MSNKCVKVGAVGSIITVLCCVTPILVILFGAVGLSALVGWLDYVLFPVLAVFIVILGFGLWQKKSN